MVAEAEEGLNVNSLRKLINSMPRRLQMFIEAKEGAINVLYLLSRTFSAHFALRKSLPYFLKIMSTITICLMLPRFQLIFCYVIIYLHTLV
jgi:hypothetical protein